MLVLAVAVAWLSLSGLVSFVALRRGLPPVEFFAVSILISPVLALPFAVIFRDPEKMILAGKARRCPYCRHVVKIKIEICPHCGLEIPNATQPLADSPRVSTKAEGPARSKAVESGPAKVAGTTERDAEVRQGAARRALAQDDALRLAKKPSPEPVAEPAASPTSGAAKPPAHPDRRSVQREPRSTQKKLPHSVISPWKKPSTIAALALVAILMFTGIGLLVRASRQRAAAAAPELFQAEVAVSTPTWVALFSDDEKVFVGALEPGKSMVFSAKQKLTISAETPDNVTIKVNGTPTVFAGQQFSTLVVRKGEAMTRSH